MSLKSSFLFTLVLFLTSHLCTAQTDDLDVLYNQIEEHSKALEGLESQVESIKLGGWMDLLIASGLPTQDYVTHSGMALSFDEEKHQARWVAHIISPEIEHGSVARTNDFRDDPKVEGEAIEKDYFLKFLEPDSSYRYDGFGYDRGHLAPSADFRWSKTALSESYFYSNMSPQHPDFNREGWAEMEAVLRGYVLRNEAPLYVVTLPMISAEADYIERGVQQLPIPEEFIKLAVDPENGNGVAFRMPNRPITTGITQYLFSIDDMETYTGLDFFSSLDVAGAEADFDIEDWFPKVSSGGVQPIYPPDLPPGHVNTDQAKLWMGSAKKVHVCGTVVSTRFSSSGNYWMNLDQKFPDTVFSAYIRKDDFPQFDAIFKDYLIDEQVCFYGKVTSMYGVPNMTLEKQEQITPFTP